MVLRVRLVQLKLVLVLQKKVRGIYGYLVEEFYKVAYGLKRRYAYPELLAGIDMIEQWLDEAEKHGEVCQMEHRLVWALFRLIEKRDRLFGRMETKLHLPDLVMLYKTLLDLRQEQLRYPDRIKQKKDELDRLKEERLRDARQLEKEFMTQILSLTKSVHAISSKIQSKGDLYYQRNGIMGLVEKCAELQRMAESKSQELEKVDLNLSESVGSLMGSLKWLPNSLLLLDTV